MAAVEGPNNFGLFRNGDFRNGISNFSFGTLNTTHQRRGTACLQYTGGGYGTGMSDEYIPVDTSKTYQMLVFAKTIQRSSAGNLAGGHIGFATFDKNYQAIGLEECGGVANTYLTRALNTGDSYAYVSNTNNQWQVVGTYYFNIILFYPSTHPDYSTPYGLSRVATYYNEITDIGGGELRLRLANSSLVTTPCPNFGYATPINTPISNGVAGGSYCYALGAPDYPETWTQFATPPFTGENRNSSYPFRFGTKYIKFLILLNYNHGGDVPQNCVWLLDDIFFGRVEDGKDYRNIII